MTYWTLQYGGVEKPLADWQMIADFSINWTNKQAAVLSFRTPENLDNEAIQFATRQPVIVRRDRQSADGSANSFSSGTIVFQGFFLDPSRSNSGGKQYIRYQAKDVLWLFGRNAFKQTRTVLSYDAQGNSTPITAVCSEVYLGQKPDETLMTAAEQVAEIVAWMNTSFNPTRHPNAGAVNATLDVVSLGTVDPKNYFWVQRKNSLSCLEALIASVRLTTDLIIYVDSSVTPPTLNVRQVGKWTNAVPPVFQDYTNLPEITLDISAETEQEILAASNTESQRPGVMIYYTATQTINGQSKPWLAIDKFPATVTDFDPEILCLYCELSGMSRDTLTHTPTVTALPAIASANAAGKAWWIQEDPSLSGPYIDQSTIVISGATVTDQAGNAIDIGAYPYVLQGTLPDWVGADTVKAVIKAYAAYSSFADADHYVPIGQVQQKQLSKSVTLTNAQPREYSVISSYDSGDSVPVGIAESIYRSLQAAQWTGSINLVADSVRSDITLGKRLKLVGPNMTFSNCIVQSVTISPHSGMMRVEFGPISPIDAPNLVEIMRAVRPRTTYNLPSRRSTGTPAGGSTDLSAETPINYMTHGSELKLLDFAIYPR